MTLQKKGFECALEAMGVWQGVAMDSLKFHLGPPYPTLLRPAVRPPLRRPYSHFKGGLPKLSSTPLDTPRRTHTRTPMLEAKLDQQKICRYLY
jgi:hypothetical protein